MNILDRVFELVFARFRRELGDQQRDEAWRRANSSVSAYMFWAFSGCIAISEIALFSLIKLVPPDEEKKVVVISGVAIGLMVSQSLKNRFRKYLSSPPPLSSSESPIETSYVRWFRVISVCIFILMCLIGYYMHKFGL